MRTYASLPSHDQQYPHGLVSLSPLESRMAAILQRLEGPAPSLEPLDRASRYMQPLCVHYTLDGRQGAA